jgi:hypothetical protein
MSNRQRGVSDAEADKSLESLVTGPLVPATGFERFGETEEPPAKVTDPAKTASSDAELKLLRAIVDNPLRPSSEYPGLAHISPNTFQKLRAALINRGLIRERKLETGDRRGRSTLLLEPLDAARELLSAAGEKMS